ncbi:hypothetical protein Lpp125_00847 [Lacticaseibacillus paracasei subsp. paracasei Lpp125]|uniref:DUF1642 domain-containing protein n=1 Tax=Lacticaseibacillus paracasei TaxID=1597 RepID=UPI00034375F9|nr:DUF1642 domain-containing protein [Lacticaseibacillus paracasei]EPD02462.1 hypothetical protein Lpp125_00847 [Lacticaseibacillus paracasei subsp. paracasei Lpp125]
MSEEKLYAVKNTKGLYLSFSADTLHRWREGQVDATTSQRIAHDLCTQHGGHVVTLIEEPEKEAVSESVGGAIDTFINADTYVQAAAALNYLFASRKKKDFKRIMKAVRNGYTVKKKKYLVYKVLGGKQKHELFAQAYRPAIFPDTITWSVGERRAPKTGVSAQFSEAEIEHYGLQDCEKEEVTDDEQ